MTSGLTCPACNKTSIPASASACPRCGAALSAAGGAPGQRVEATRMESVGDLRAAISSVRSAPAAEPRDSTLVLRPVESPFRPQHRPPQAKVCMLDDGRRTGEWVRLRTAQCVIGRSDGDIVVSHDERISGRHAEIVRMYVDGRWRWRLRDLNSTNGTFVRVSTAQLKHEQELLIGQTRLRFDAMSGPHPASAGAAAGATRQWQAPRGPAAGDGPRLVELLPEGDGRVFSLRPAGVNVIGADAKSCSVVLENDEFVAHEHARLQRDDRAGWQLTATRTINGTWLRVAEAYLEGGGEFFLGEQRFLFKDS